MVKFACRTFYFSVVAEYVKAALIVVAGKFLHPVKGVTFDTLSIINIVGIVIYYWIKKSKIS